MDEIELEIAIAEEEARAKQKAQNMSGPVELNSSIGAPVELNVPLGQREDLPPDVDSIAYQLGRDKGAVNDLMAEGYNQGAGVSNRVVMEGLGAAAFPMAKLPQAASLGTRAAIYGANALKGSLGLEAGTTIADTLNNSATQGELSGPSKSPGEMVQSVGLNTAIGTGAPLAIEGLGNAFNWVRGLFNKAPVTAKRMGATPTQLNPNAENYVTDKVQNLMDNSDFFNKNILTSADPSKQYTRAKSYRDMVGKQIGDFYATNPGIPVLRDDILASPSVQKLIARTQDPNISQATRDEAVEALETLYSALPDTPVINLADVWRTRQDLDSRMVNGIFQKGTGEPTKFNQFLQDAANGVRESMEASIASRIASPDELAKFNGMPPPGSGKISPLAAERLLKNKEEFSNIYTATEILGRKVGQTSGTDFLENLAKWSPLTQPLAPIRPGVNAMRTGAAHLGNMGQGMTSLAPMLNPYANMGSTLFQRSTDPDKVNFEELKGTVFNEALKIMHPQEAEMIVSQLDQTFTSGSQMAKRQAMTMLGMQFPDLFEPTQDGLLSVVDNRIQDPFEKDIHLQAASELDNPADRARVIGSLYDGGKYAPIDNTPMVRVEPQKNNYDLDTVFNSLSNAYEVESSPEMNSMLSELERATAIHAEDFP